jgi:hypothetical protein
VARARGRLQRQQRRPALPPGPASGIVTVSAPCGLAVTSVHVAGPCQWSDSLSTPAVYGLGVGTCDVSVSLSNGVTATASVPFTSGPGPCGGAAFSSAVATLDVGFVLCSAAGPCAPSCACVSSYDQQGTLFVGGVGVAPGCGDGGNE